MENKHSQMMSISQSYHDTLLEFGKNWVKIMLVAAIPQAVVYLLLISATVLGVSAFGSLLTAGGEFNWSYIILAGVIIVVGLFVALLGLISLYYMIIHHEKVTVGEAFEHSFKYLWSYMVQAVIAAILSAGGTAVGYLIVSIVGTVFGLFDSELLTPVFNILSYFVPYVTGTAVGIFFYFAGYSVIEKGEGGIAAIKHSYQLVKGHYWPVLVRGLLLTGVVVAIGFVLNLIPYIGAVLSVLTLTPFSVIYVYTLYKDVEKLNA